MLNPTNRTHCSKELFKTDGQKSYTGIHDALCSLPQSWAPLLIWFLFVFAKQMTLQRMKSSEVVMPEEAEKEYLTRTSTVSYTTPAKYENYVFASIVFDDIQFVWPTRKQHIGKSKGQEDETKRYAGFVAGSLVQIEVEVSQGPNVNIQLIVAERNFSREGSQKATKIL